jgi:hypothetical protein
MTLVKNKSKYDLYFDTFLIYRTDAKNIVIKGGGDLYIGGSSYRAGATGA